MAACTISKSLFVQFLGLNFVHGNNWSAIAFHLFFHFVDCSCSSRSKGKRGFNWDYSSTRSCEKRGKTWGNILLLQRNFASSCQPAIDLFLVALDCPDTHKNSYNDYDHCCSSSVHKDDNMTVLTEKSPLDACATENRYQCSHGNKCRDRRPQGE